jgi:UDP-N-acetyl-D-galactosamine dehydrogenase
VSSSKIPILWLEFQREVAKLELDKIAVIGLGYVGLPLAVEFGKRCRTIGFDLSEKRVASLRQFIDPRGETSSEKLRAANKLEVTTDPSRIREAEYIIVAVPTPVDEAHQPDFRPLISASETAGRHLKQGATVIYESTVYPGATEEICIPVLEQFSGLKWQRDFFVGYSPERINPGDQVHSLTNTVKVVAGDTADTLERVAQLYEMVVTAGVCRTTSIKVAEAAKVIENTQRDINIALMNECALIFNQLGIDTLEVLKAAGTKWNFLHFFPGLVGGHCIGVDPYYLTRKAESIGYHPQVILAGRRINDSMGKYIAEQTIKNMINAGSAAKGAKVIVLGLTFKENCSDLRNSKVADLIRELKSFGVGVYVHDPVADAGEAMHEYGVTLLPWDALPQAAAIVAAVGHREFAAKPLDAYVEKAAEGCCFIDVKSAFDRPSLEQKGFTVWRL